jgi:UDP-arabinose 4-epimerase
VRAVLVTGGAGYVGSHACKALARAGYVPVTLDNLVNGHRWAVQWGPLEVGDIADVEFVQGLIAKYRPLALMHFAAFAYVGESVAEPSKYYLNNIVGGLKLLEACRTRGVDKVVFSSTCATYGVPGRLPIGEDQPQEPVNPYGWSKLVVERALLDYDRAWGLRSLSLRYFNAAGADPEADIGELHEPETHLIPLLLDAIAGSRPQLTVHGNDYPTPDGTCVRDFVHVTDLAHAHVAGLEHLLAGGATGALNLGTGTGHSVLQVIEAAQRVTGRKAPYAFGVRRPGDAPVLVADAARAGELLRWRPRHSSLDEIVASAWAWHRKERRGERDASRAQAPQEHP